MTKETTLRKIFLDELKDVYHAEKQLVKALPKLAKASTSPDLRTALEEHLGETETQVERLEKVFEMLGETAKAKVCPGMQGIIEEGSELLKEEDKGPVLDAGIIAGAQRAEHYEMAAYGTLIAWAEALGMDDVISLLNENLEEEKAADEKLSEIAEDGINAAAAAGQEDSEETEDEEETVGAGAGSNRARPPAKSKASRR